MWTSIVSKEAILSSAFCLILGCFYDSYRRQKVNKLILFVSLGLIFIIKIYFLLPILLLLFLSFAKPVLERRFVLVISIFYSVVAVIFSCAIIFEQEITAVFSIIRIFFNTDEGTVRTFIEWDQEYGFAWYLIPGTFLAFWGPTLGEVQQEPIKAFFFFESGIIFLALTYLFHRVYIKIWSNLRIRIYLFLGIFAVITSVLILLYPYGALNSGSALRYRSGVFPLIFLLTWMFEKLYFERSMV